MEFVYVVDRAELFGSAFPHGFVRRGESPDLHDVDRFLSRIREHGFFLERRRAEQDPRFKQVIPYCLVRCGGDLLCIERLSTQSERRLHGLLSIGIGGHIEPIDAGDVLDAGARRELEEELTLLRALGALNARGIINDESTPVGAVHFGVVYEVEVAAPEEAAIRETEHMSARWRDQEELIDEARRHSERFETWSSLILARLGECDRGVGLPDGREAAS